MIICLIEYADPSPPKIGGDAFGLFARKLILFFVLVHNVYLRYFYKIKTIPYFYLERVDHHTMRCF